MGCSASTSGGTVLPTDTEKDPGLVVGGEGGDGGAETCTLEESGLRVVEVTPAGRMLLLRLGEEIRPPMWQGKGPPLLKTITPHKALPDNPPHQGRSCTPPKAVLEGLLMREAYLSSCPSVKIGETQLIAAGEEPEADPTKDADFEDWDDPHIPLSPRGCEDVAAGVTCIIACDQRLPSFLLGQRLLLGNPVKPFGVFNSTLDTDRVVVLCADAGIGRVYPWLRQSILCPNDHPLPPMKVTLYYQVPRRMDIAFARDFDTWEADQYSDAPPAHPHLFTVHYALTAPDDDWGGLSGSLASHPPSALHDLQDTTVYLAGPRTFVEDVAKHVLQTSGVPEHRVHVCIT